MWRYLIPVAVRGFLPARGAGGTAAGQFEAGNPGPGNSGPGQIGLGGHWQIEEAPLFCLVPLCFTALASLVLFFYANDLYAFLQPIGGGG